VTIPTRQLLELRSSSAHGARALSSGCFWAIIPTRQLLEPAEVQASTSSFRSVRSRLAVPCHISN
jgi:hypothetical protein